MQNMYQNLPGHNSRGFYQLSFIIPQTDMFFVENRTCVSALLEGNVRKKKLLVTFNESSSVFLCFVLGTVISPRRTSQIPLQSSAPVSVLRKSSVLISPVPSI